MTTIDGAVNLQQTQHGSESVTECHDQAVLRPSCPLHAHGSLIPNPHCIPGPHVLDPGQTAAPDAYDSYKSKQSQALGICHMVCGFLFIVCNSVGIHVDAWGAISAHGIIAGILFIVTGCFGIAAAAGSTKCKITTFMVLSILSAVTTVVTLAISSAGWSKDSSKYRSSKCVRNQNTGQYICTDDYYVALAMNAMMVFLSIGEAIVAIWSAAICCAVKCCGKKKTLTNDMQVQYVVATTTPNAMQSQYVAAANSHNAMQPQYVVATTPPNAMQPQYVVATTPQNAMQPKYVVATTCSCGAGAVILQPRNVQSVQTTNDECGSSPVNNTEVEKPEPPPAYPS